MPAKDLDVIKAHLLRDHDDCLREFEERHAEHLEALAEYQSICSRLTDLDGGPDFADRACERRRAHDKARLVLQRAEAARVARDSAHVRLEAVRFRAQLALGLSLAPINLPSK